MREKTDRCIIISHACMHTISEIHTNTPIQKTIQTYIVKPQTDDKKQDQNTNKT